MKEKRKETSRKIQEGIITVKEIGDESKGKERHHVRVRKHEQEVKCLR